MSAFEFFFSFYGLILGLSVAELLGGFARTLNRNPRPRFGLLTPLLVRRRSSSNQTGGSTWAC